MRNGGKGSKYVRRVGCVALLALFWPAGSNAQTMPAVPPAGGAGAGQATPQGRPGMAPVGVPVAGMPFVHDPSTVVRFHGRYYVFSTGKGIPFYSSPDLATWTREGSVFETIPEDVHAAVPKNDGTGVWAPDIVRVNGQFLLYYAVSFWGSFNSVVALATNTTLDPRDPAYKWVDRGVIVRSDGVEDLNAIDPGAMLASDGTLWVTYGSYHGSIRILQLDPKTGLPFAGKGPNRVAVARESEASSLIEHDGYFYLFVNHGSCCRGKDSQYNIRVGRSRRPEGPYLDRHNRRLTEAPGVLFLASHDHRVGPGHFSRLLDYDAAPKDGLAPGGERFSVHYEADMERNGRPTLDVRPLLWSLDGWPMAGDNLLSGTYQIVSRDSENTLGIYTPAQPKTDNPPVPAPAAAGPPAPSTANTAPVREAKPAGPPVLRLNRYLTLPNEKWLIAPARAGLYTIVNAGTGDALEVRDASHGAAEAAVGFAPSTGAEAQRWTLEQMPDGAYAIRNPASGLALTSSAKGTVSATQFVKDDVHLWTITTP